MKTLAMIRYSGCDTPVFLALNGDYRRYNGVGMGEVSIEEGQAVLDIDVDLYREFTANLAAQNKDLEFLGTPTKDWDYFIQCELTQLPRF